MLIRFGWIDGFSRTWWEAVQAAGRNNPGSRMVLNSILAVLRLVEICDANRRGRDMSLISDEELDEEIVHGAEMLIASRPELAVAAAERLGWTVIPPGAPHASASLS